MPSGYRGEKGEKGDSVQVRKILNLKLIKVHTKSIT